MVDMLPVLRVLGILAMIFSLSMGVPLAVSLWTHDGVWRVYAIAMAATLAVGAWLGWRLRLCRQGLQPRQGVMRVSRVWILPQRLAGMPLVVAGTVPARAAGAARCDAGVDGVDAAAAVGRRAADAGAAPNRPADVVLPCVFRGRVGPDHHGFHSAYGAGHAAGVGERVAHVSAVD